MILHLLEPFILRGSSRVCCLNIRGSTGGIFSLFRWFCLTPQGSTVIAVRYFCRVLTFDSP